MQARRRTVIERCLRIIRFMAPQILSYALATRPNEPPVFWYSNTAELSVFYWNYREYVRRSGGKPTLIKVENNVLEITRRVLRREYTLVSRIQARWRGLATRMVFRDFKRQKGWLKGIRQSPAVKIQRLVRGVASRRRCQALQVTTKYSAQREAYRKEREARKQQTKALAFRQRLMTKYKHQFQINRTTRMIVQKVKMPLIKKHGADSSEEEDENDQGPETNPHIQHSLKSSAISNNDKFLGGVLPRSTNAVRFAEIKRKLESKNGKLRGPKLHILKAQMYAPATPSNSSTKQLSNLQDKDVVAVSCGSRHTMALTASGAVYSWGWGSMGQLGHGDLKSINEPQKIDFFEKEGHMVDYISCGGCHSAAVTNDGTLYMWGESHWGQLGLPKEYDAAHESLPVKCPMPEGEADEVIVKVSCGGTHTAALTSLGHVYVWGRGDSGQLGIGSAWLKDPENESLMGASRPHLVKGFDGEKVVQVACGAFHSAAVTEQGHVYIWGKEDYGMLGVGQSSDQQIPKRLDYFDDIPVLRVSCGGWHTVVVAKSGDCYAFGRGEYGRLGLSDTKSRTRPHLVRNRAFYYNAIIT
ncbi:hypothetical protein AM588_10011026 [Phytophthora nicotianae]|uniref:RCC1-like domain-containing protein n=1 Tax=Phytophthora nicotianae TaxID=4792 RepID=A0A0W8DLB9_PHYNI|nr:hypothetical protein AM588_10011026 [Phytophthora nicotianae]